MINDSLSEYRKVANIETLESEILEEQSDSQSGNI
tara:strand:+ start:512 stop:616 length:105 start_codon:yes stop_codon:yes gene_type:complete